MKSEWNSYRKINCIIGWIMFVVASFVYVVTAEPTVSFWDCGEFILSAFKLQIGHPPGAPIFLMIDRLATMFAFGDVTKVALMANILSAICSGLTIMFLFWSITCLIKRSFIGKDEDPEGLHLFATMGAGVLGALAYTFSDTFWFSAVEGELYAMSSLFTAIVFWAALKWDEESEDEHSGRWIIFIAFMMGLGLGVHRLSLLVLPIMVFAYYFKKYEFSWIGFLKACVLAVVLLGGLVFVLIPGVPKVAGWFELLFVNVLGMKYNTGLLFFILVVIGLLVLGIRYTIKNKKVILNYCITCITVIMIGYSSYALIVIRSSANPPMNQNNPADIFSLSYYINMEQYGSAPKLFGQYYSAPRTDDKEALAGYNKVDGKYEPYYRVEYGYDERFKTLFPRMYSSSEGHPQAYQYWGKIKGRKYSVRTGSETQTVVCPTFSENLRFFFRYQCGFMYWRYFMWNFAGRQNDIQGNGNPMYGNWISGINFIDDLRLGDQDDLPEDLLSNRGRNRYYCIPLILGILGLIWQYKKDNKGFILVLTFFIMTGLAIIVFLNQYPNQPRERDYAYAGSFYAYAIWIGLGLMSVYELVSKYIKNKKVAAIAVSTILLAACPMLMAKENWDDHDRSNRYTAKAVGSNYLNSVDKDAILFSYGDNDSFPLWYAQEDEGIRTDVKVANLSYFQAGWYIKVMRQQAYDSKPLPMSIENEKYRDGTRDQLLINTSSDK
ncbi:MAG: DUF2723 domain-containing protein, partial [Bacteroidales bacterium]|nr:DUF2723 domain-containing protein [Bacteroidales bacterium]